VGGAAGAAFYVFFVCGARERRVYFFPQLAGCFDSDESRDINLQPTHPERARPTGSIRIAPCARRKCT
jgi:hypothetical protein